MSVAGLDWWDGLRALNVALAVLVLVAVASRAWAWRQMTVSRRFHWQATALLVLASAYRSVEAVLRGFPGSLVVPLTTVGLAWCIAALWHAETYPRPSAAHLAQTSPPHPWRHLMSLLKPLAPFLALVIVAVLQTLAVALTDSQLTVVEVLTILITLATALTTYVVPNATSGVARYLKPITAAAGAVLAGAVTFLADGSITSQEVVLLIIVAAGALGVVVTNGSAPAYEPRHARPAA